MSKYDIEKILWNRANIWFSNYIFYAKWFMLKYLVTIQFVYIKTSIKLKYTEEKVLHTMSFNDVDEFP